MASDRPGAGVKGCPPGSALGSRRCVTRCRCSDRDGGDNPFVDSGAHDVDLARALDRAVRGASNATPPWPERLELRDTVEELRTWLADDRQWNESRPRHWQSLLTDLLGSLDDLGPTAKSAIAEPAFRSEATECRRRFANDSTVDDALRTRLSRLVDEISEVAVFPDTLLSALNDLVSSAGEPDRATRAARHLLALAQWAGHDIESLVRWIGLELASSRPGQPTRQSDNRPLVERLEVISERLRLPAYRGHFVIWLRFRLAKVEAPRSGGHPVIQIGDGICLYQGDWLRGCLAHPLVNEDLQAELVGPDNQELKSFCGFPYDQASGQFDEPPCDSRESPVAYLRVDVGYELASKAIDVARTNAEALAGIGTLYGSSPDIWKLDDSYVSFVDDAASGSMATPASVEEPTFEQRRAVHADRTSRELRGMASRLAAHLPVRDAQLENATTMLGWLRDAAQSPPALQVVLYDRVIEAVAGWAGYKSHTAFVGEQLVPWWAYSRIRGTAIDVALRLYWDHPYARASADDDQRAAWQEIVAHEPLNMREDTEPTLSLRGIISEAGWLIQRTPMESPLGEGLVTLERKTRTGQAAASWWSELCAHATTLESRRIRTRNALMHGGALAPGTIACVAPFAKNLASEALAASLEGQLLQRQLVSHFLDRQRRIALMRDSLAHGESPSRALFDEAQ